MSGRVGDLSEVQETKLEQFKTNVADITKPEHDDYYFLRWLRARRFDLPKAEAMLRAHMETREKMNLDTIIDDFQDPEVLVKYFPGGIVGPDREGSPVYIDPMGNADSKGLMRSVKSKDILKWRMKFSEKLYRETLPEMSKQAGKRIEGMVYIADLEKLGTRHLWKPAVDLCITYCKLAESNYPETMKSIYIVRSPKIFPVVYKLLKPFIDEETRKKIKVLGNNFQDELLKIIPPESLPVHWGGTMQDEDGNKMCPSKVCLGGEVPKSYYSQEMIIPDEQQLIQSSVKHGSRIDIPLDVKYPASIIRWVFTSQDSLQFGIFYKDNEENKDVEIMAVEKYNSHLVYEDGSVGCVKAGSYLVRFDNSHHRFSSNGMHYKVEVLEPETINGDVPKPQ